MNAKDVLPGDLAHSLRLALGYADELVNIAGASDVLADVGFTDLRDQWETMAVSLDETEQDLKDLRPGKDYEKRLRFLSEKRESLKLAFPGIARELCDLASEARRRAFVDLRPEQLATLEAGMFDIDRQVVDALHGIMKLLHQRAGLMRDASARADLYHRVALDLPGAEGVYQTANGPAMLKTPYRQQLKLSGGDSTIAGQVFKAHIEHFMELGGACPDDPGERWAWFSQRTRRV